MKSLLNLICIFALAATAFAKEDWINYSSPFPIKSAVPYGEGLLMATGGGIRYRTYTADDMYTTSNGLGDQSISAVAHSELGMFAVSDNGIISVIAGNNSWQVLSRSYVGNGVRLIPGMARLANSVMVLAFQDRLAFFSLKTMTSILTIERIADKYLSKSPVDAMEVRGDSLFVAIGTSLYVRKMDWEKLESDVQLNNPDSWSVVKNVSSKEPIKSIAWKNGKIKVFSTEGTRIWDDDGETSVALDTFSVFSSSSPMVVVRGKTLMDSVLYERVSSESGSYYKSLVQWVTLLPSGKAILAGPENIFYYDGKKLKNLTEYERFALGSAYELQALPGGGVIAASEEGLLSYNYGYDWSEPTAAYEIFGNTTDARAHDMKVLSVLPNGSTFYHIWGYGYFTYKQQWAKGTPYAILPRHNNCMDDFVPNTVEDRESFSVATTPAPDGKGFLTTTASNKGYSLVYVLDSIVTCANNIGSASIGGPILASIDESTGNWIAYVGTRENMSLAADGALDVITFPPPSKTGGELSEKITKDNVKTYYGTSTTPLDMVYEPKTEYLWIVTESSLEYWNKDQDSLRSPLSTNGLTSAVFTSIDADNRGNLWVGTSSQGAYCLTPRVTNPDTLSVSHYTTRQGMLSDRVQDVAVDSSFGIVWFDHENGITRYARSDLRGSDGNMTDDARVDVKVFPNPFRPHIQARVYFDNVSEDAVINVYNRGGKLVVSLHGEQVVGGRAEWDGRMENGNFVAPGVYQYVVRGASKVKKGKLLIIH